jgi:transcriptional regulator with XRE-family HTH domain
MASFKVDITPEVLEWARRSIGLTREHAAKKVDVSQIQIEGWEEGADDPTIAQLRRMAEAYKRPLAMLLLSAPPEDFEPIRDFRLLPTDQDRPLSPELLTEIRRVQMQRAVARELPELADDVPPLIDLAVHLTDDPEIAGEAIRSWLGPLRTCLQSHGGSLMENTGPMICRVRSSPPPAQLTGQEARNRLCRHALAPDPLPARKRMTRRDAVALGEFPNIQNEPTPSSREGAGG